MKAGTTSSMAEGPGQPAGANVVHNMKRETPLTPQSQNTPLPGQTSVYPAVPAPVPAPAAAPPTKTPAKTTIKALPTVRDHTTDQLNAAGDEYLPRETDEYGEKKVMPNGTLCGGREYRIRTFLVPNRGDKLFMLATECARVLGYRDSYLLFNKNRSLFKIIATQAEKDDLVSQEILPFSYRSRQIAIVTARSMFRQFGSRVIVAGRRVRDDYWETKARKQGFTENDMAGEKRPGAAKAREAAAQHEAAQASMMMPPGDMGVYQHSTAAPFPGPTAPHLVQQGMLGGAALPTAPKMPGLTMTPEQYDPGRRGEYSSIIKAPRQEIAGPAYQDQTRGTSVADLTSQAQQAAEFNRSIGQQRDTRNELLNRMWGRPHEQPATTNLTPAPASTESSLPATSRPPQSPHSATSAIMPNQSPQMMMTAAPYPQSTVSQAPIRGMGQPSSSSQTPTYLPAASAPGHKSSKPTNMSPAGSTTSNLPQGQSYNYPPSNQMWPQTPQTPGGGYSPAYTTQAGTAQAQQSPAPQMRHSSGGGMQPNMQFGGMPSMSQNYGYPAEQTPRQYMSQGQGSPAVTQGWSNQGSQQWWANPQPQ